MSSMDYALSAGRNGQLLLFLGLCSIRYSVCSEGQAYYTPQYIVMSIYLWMVKHTPIE